MDEIKKNLNEGDIPGVMPSVPKATTKAKVNAKLMSKDGFKKDYDWTAVKFKSPKMKIAKKPKAVKLGKMRKARGGITRRR